MKKLLCFLTLICTFQLTQAQDSTSYCGTADMDSTEFTQLPWFDNNDVLEAYLDSIGYVGGSGGSSNRIITTGIRYHIPVSWWIYRDDAGNGGPNLQQIQMMMDNLNRLYLENNTGIAFYMNCTIHYVNNSNHVNKTFVGANLLIGSDRDFGAMNIHVVNSIGGGVSGIGLKPMNGLIITRSSYEFNVPTSTLAHEMGHVFGLVHTHLYSAWNFKCLTECISRTRDWPFFNLCPAPRWKEVCESTGDGLRDTPADPNLQSNFSCSYVGGGTDPWGDSYASPPHGNSEKPDPRNVMSYNAMDNCISIFSRLQIGVMLRTIKHQKNSVDESHWKDSKYIFDSYEPDNSSLIARTILPNENQERNFHQQYENSGFGPTTTQCDEDWVKFTATSSGTVLITTSVLGGYASANTRLTLYNSALVQVAQNDNISSTNLFSSISFTVTSGQTYFIKVDNMSPGITGYYNLFVSCANAGNPATYQLNGQGLICTSEVYSITNLPSNTTVSWSVSPSGYVSITPNGSQATLTKISNGNITLTATIITCSQPVILTKNIHVGNYIYSDYPVTGPSSASCNQTLSFSTVTLPGATNYNWVYPSDWYYISGQGTQYLTLQTPSNSYGGAVGVMVDNTCGYSGSPNLKFVQIYGCYGYYSYSVSPNPATSQVTVSAKEDKTNQSEKHTGITQINIYDQQSSLRKSQKFGKVKNGTVDISNLPLGVYIIEIIDGDYKERQQLSVVK